MVGIPSAAASIGVCDPSLGGSVFPINATLEICVNLTSSCSISHIYRLFWEGKDCLIGNAKSETVLPLLSYFATSFSMSWYQ